MRIDILTLFPEMFSAMQESIIGRAQKTGKIEINIVNIRDYTEDKHLKCDDYPFGGGAGMVMMPQPIGSAIEALDPQHKARRIYMSPKGQAFKQQKVFELLEYEHLILLCGHYEGVDQRVIDLFIDEEISIGDYVLTGGRIARYGGYRLCLPLRRRGNQSLLARRRKLFGKPFRISAIHPSPSIQRACCARGFTQRRPREGRRLEKRASDCDY